MKLVTVFIGFLCVVSSSLHGQDEPRGTIKGNVVDAETLEPLIGVNILVKDTQIGAATDSKGSYIIEDVPVGSYALTFRYISYEPISKTDVIVKSHRVTFVHARMQASAIEGEETVIHAGYFSESEEQPSSTTSFSSEEIRRAPGSAGDVSRIIYGLPSVAKVNDTKNSLIVRGGGPTENGFYVDNIEIPNINHFPEQGSSGGPIGMINVDFIRDVDFLTGGFSAIYSDRLSSIMDIRFREGNRDEFDGQLDLSFAGFGAIAEGPLPDETGSWMVSARRSFLDLIVNAIGEDASSVPEYSDVQGKAVFDVAPDHQISVLDILAIDNISQKAEDAVKDEDSIYPDFEFVTNTAGANWRYLWGNGFSNTSVSHRYSGLNFQGYETREFDRTGVEKVLFDLRPVENDFTVRNVNHLRINSSNKVDFGFEVKYSNSDYDNFYGTYNDPLGNAIEEYEVVETIQAIKVFGFLGYEWRPVDKLTVTPGLNVGHFSYNDNTNISPRLAINVQVDSKSSFSLAAGIFHQYLPLPLLAQNPGNKNLKDPVAFHAIAGYRRLLTDDTRLTVEVYEKQYRNFPLDPVQPQLFVIDQVVETSVFFNPNDLVDKGRAYTRGVELMIQKKLASDFYGILSASYFRSRYRDLNETWRNREFDNRFTFQAEGGYKPNRKWEFSLRWIFAGGRPYTPFDETASASAERGVLDVNRINEERLPDYHSLNLRMDRRFNFNRSGLIFYLSVWNVYGRKNLDDYVWNEVTNQRENVEQWGTIPVFGVEYEF